MKGGEKMKKRTSVILLIVLCFVLLLTISAAAGDDTWQPPIPGDYECRLHESHFVEEAGLLVETWHCTQTDFYLENDCTYLVNIGWKDPETRIETSRNLYDCTQHRVYIPAVLSDSGKSEDLAPDPTPMPPRGAPWYCTLWATIEDPDNPAILDFPYTDRTAWCADIWDGEILTTLVGSGWCNEAGCDPVCRAGYCADGLNPQESVITVSGDGIQWLAIYTVSGRPTPAPMGP
jgi:hypothetical protein